MQCKKIFFYYYGLALHDALTGESEEILTFVVIFIYSILKW